MTQRIVYEFDSPAGTSTSEWKKVKGVLQAAGAKHIADPAGGTQEILTAVLPDVEQAKSVIEQLRQLPGVGRAELDASREIFD